MKASGSVGSGAANDERGSRLALVPRPRGEAEVGVRPARRGPVDATMSFVIGRLAHSRLASPRVAVTVAATGLLMSLVVAATAPNPATLDVALPLSRIFPQITDGSVAYGITYTGNVLACLGLAGMLWANARGWMPDPKRMLLISSGVVAVAVSLSPVGSSDTASYAAYGRIASQGGDPYVATPFSWGDHAYSDLVSQMWFKTPSVYGPVATWVQSVAAWIGGKDPATTIWMLMILNGAVFLAIGYLLYKTADDPVRAGLFWVANPVIIQQLVIGGHLDTFVAAAAICAIQVARKATGLRGDLLVGVLIGVACGVKINAALIGLGLAWPLLRRREWMRTLRVGSIAVATTALVYSAYGWHALKPLSSASKLVSSPSPWRWVQMAGTPWLGKDGMATLIGFMWPFVLLILAWYIYHRISHETPPEMVAPFALSFAWILVTPWVLPWYAALAWVSLTQVPRNPMTRWLTLVTVFLALTRTGGGHAWAGLGQQ